MCRGNFAVVKLAIDKATGGRFAIKIIDKKKYLNQAGSRKEALMDEVTILRSLNHQNIIHIEEIFDTEKTLYLSLIFLCVFYVFYCSFVFVLCGSVLFILIGDIANTILLLYTILSDILFIYYLDSSSTSISTSASSSFLLLLLLCFFFFCSLDRSTRQTLNNSIIPILLSSLFIINDNQNVPGARVDRRRRLIWRHCERGTLQWREGKECVWPNYWCHLFPSQPGHCSSWSQTWKYILSFQFL